MRPILLAIIGCGFAASCSPAPARSATDDAERWIDSLNSRIVQAYRGHDPAAYGALYTDSAVFEWPAIASVRGRAGMATMARENWATLSNMDLKLAVTARRISGDHATEFGAFEQSWDSDSGRKTEFGRYAVALVRQRDGKWLMDHFLGFEDSTRVRVRR
jgi:ketosteroid isomerase-like protein